MLDTPICLNRVCVQMSGPFCVLRDELSKALLWAPERDPR